MKKFAFLPLVLCLLLVLQCTVFPVYAVPIPVSTEETENETATQESEAPPQGSAIPFGQVSILNGCRTIEGMVPLGGNERRLPSAVSAFVYERNTNTVIYSFNPDMKVAPGSLAKLVTALLAIELCDVDEVVTINSSNIARLPAGSQNVDLRNGEQLTVKDLLHCMILQSANDAAIVLAEHISGNPQGFVVLMNERVKKMGCINTQFENVHGLDNATNFTTARDMAKITTEALKNETFRELFSAKEYIVPETEKSKERKFQTQNYMMDDTNIIKYFDDRVTGGMQSYVSVGAGASMVCSALSKDKSMDLVCVVMGCTREIADNGWQVLSYGNLDEMTDLLEYVFGNFKVNRILYEGQALNQFAVSGGESQAVGQPRVNYDTVLWADCQMDNLIKYYTVTGGGLSAPVAKGEMISTVEIWYRNSCVAEAERYSMGNVKSTGDSASISGQDMGKEGSNALSILGTVCVVILGVVGGYLAINAWRRSRAQARRRRRRAGRRRSN